MTDLTDDTTAIRARSKGVTAWRTEMTADRHWNVIYAQTDLDNDWRIALVSDDDDAEFIAHAPTDVAFLLARVEQLENVIAYSRPNLTERYDAAQEELDSTELTAEELTQRVTAVLLNAFADGALWQFARTVRLASTGHETE